jgi:glutamate/tyrosine decarboxylase-like PLP-dependent enzyme
MDRLLASAATRAARYLRDIQTRSAAPSLYAVAALSKLREPMPALPTDPEAVLALLDDIGSPATTAMAGPRFFGLVMGGVVPAALAANWLAAAWDQNPTLYITSPIAAELEEISLAWLLDLLGLPPACAGGFVTGATAANFTALAAARGAVLRRAGWDVEANGLFGAPEIAVFAGAESHPSVSKALGMLGLGRDRITRLPVDAQGRIIADSLPPIHGPAIVCIQAGNVNSGAFDPAPQLIEWAHAANAWVHVDGAFGLWAAASPTLAHLVAGFEAADSWATDAHKWLNVPYDSGLAFVRDAAALRAAMSITAAYLPQGDQREPSQYVPELSRRARGIEIWAALKSMGRSGLADLIDGNCRCARRFAAGLIAAGFEVFNEVVLNQVVVAFGSQELTDTIVQAIQKDGTCWCGGTSWRGRAAIRISVSSWRTTEEDVDRSLDAIIRLAVDAGIEAQRNPDQDRRSHAEAD